MTTRRVWTVLCVGAVVGVAGFSLQARQAADRAVSQSLRVVLPVTDLNRSVEFYRTVLEFESANESANLLPIVRGNALVAAMANGLPLPAPDSMVLSVAGQHLELRQVPREGSRPQGIRLIVYVANPGAYVARLRARGAAVDVQVTGPDRQPAGFVVTDPDGYQLYFAGRVVS